MSLVFVCELFCRGLPKNARHVQRSCKAIVQLINPFFGNNILVVLKMHTSVFRRVFSFVSFFQHIVIR